MKIVSSVQQPIDFCCSFCRVSQYRFCQIMAENLPRLREEIKEISMSDLKDFLESIRKHSDKVGEMAMRQVQERNSVVCENNIKVLLNLLIYVSLKAHKHRIFNSALTKQTYVGHCDKPVYSLIGPAHSHVQNGLMIDDDEVGIEEEADEEVIPHVLVFSC